MDVTSFLPTVERGRASGVELLSFSPGETIRLCALVVTAELDGERGYKRMFETYLPKQLTAVPALFHFESYFEERTTKHPVLPKALRCPDLKPVQTGGAYRVAQFDKQPDFHGFDFCDTIAAAGASLERFFLGAGDDAKFDIYAHAWPLLWLRYPLVSSEHVLWVGADGALAHFVGVSPEED